MEKEFIPMDLALRLKALGFDEPCLAVFNQEEDLYICHSDSFESEDTFYSQQAIEKIGYKCLAPIFSQAFRFFREKYMIGHDIMCPFISYQGKNAEIISEGRYEVFLTDEEQLGITDEEFYSMTYNEAEIKCLNLLLRIVESKTE